MMHKYGYHGWQAGEFTEAVHAVAKVLDDYVQDSQHGKVPVLRQTPPESLINSAPPSRLYVPPMCGARYRFGPCRSCARRKQQRHVLIRDGSRWGCCGACDH